MYKITPRELRKDEIAIVPFDNNMFVVIREDKVNSKFTLSDDPRYKVQWWNKEFDSYAETTYNLTYSQARRQLAKHITF